MNWYDNLTIKNIEFIDNGNVDERECVCTLSNGTQIHIASCYESWEQWGGVREELGITVDVADYVNDWLHGGEQPNIDFFIE